MAESNEILEGKYIRADKLQKAIHNFLRNKDKADMYREIAEIYKSLGDYKDSPAKYEACLKKAAEHDELAKDEKEVLPTVPTEKKDKKKSPCKTYYFNCVWRFGPWCYWWSNIL